MPFHKFLGWLTNKPCLDAACYTCQLVRSFLPQAKCSSGHHQRTTDCSCSQFVITAIFKAIFIFMFHSGFSSYCFQALNPKGDKLFLLLLACKNLRNIFNLTLEEKDNNNHFASGKLHSRSFCCTNAASLVHSF